MSAFASSLAVKVTNSQDTVNVFI
ncbi:MAG: hypothetical protein RL013_1032, partial [Bacteroidota bacterium]